MGEDKFKKRKRGIRRRSEELRNWRTQKKDKSKLSLRPSSFE